MNYVREESNPSPRYFAPKSQFNEARAILRTQSWDTVTYHFMAKSQTIPGTIFILGESGTLSPLFPKTWSNHNPRKRPSSFYYSNLEFALADLHGAKREALEEGFPPPSNLAIGNATRLLKEVHGILPCRFEVYPTPMGEIAIYAPGGYGRSVLLLCDSDGGALCSVNINGTQRQKRYSNVNNLPDDFVRKALLEMAYRYHRSV